MQSGNLADRDTIFQRAVVEPIYSVYREQFNSVALVKVYGPLPDEQAQNVLVLASDTDLVARLPAALKAFPEAKWLQDYRPQRSLVLTDDFAPIEQYYLSGI